MGDGEGSGVEELAEFSIVDQALTNALYIANKKQGIVNPLGMSDFDWWIENILSCAGIKLELLKRGGEPELYNASQIVEESERMEFMRNRRLDNFKLAAEDEMLGLQVKLNGAHHWKVTVADENHAQHHAVTKRAATGRKATAIKTTTFENTHIYEIAVPVPGQGMRCMTAYADGITINIAFKTSMTNDIKDARWNPANQLPMIEQRRIDGIFTNKFVTVAQVCSVPRVP